MTGRPRRGVIPAIPAVLVVASVIATLVGYGKIVFNAWFIGVCVLIVAGLLSMFYLLVAGTRKQAATQGDQAGEFPQPPAEPGEVLRGPDTGLYVGSTFAPSWRERVTVGDVSDRASATLAEHADGVLIARQGASDLWIPRASISSVRTDRGLAGKVMSADGILVIRWALPNGTEIDSGVRADDKTIYPGWVSAFAGTQDSGQGTQE